MLWFCACHVGIVVTVEDVPYSLTSNPHSESCFIGTDGRVCVSLVAAREHLSFLGALTDCSTLFFCRSLSLSQWAASELFTELKTRKDEEE